MEEVNHNNQYYENHRRELEQINQNNNIAPNSNGVNEIALNENSNTENGQVRKESLINDEAE